MLDRAVAAGGEADSGQHVDGSYMGYFADLDGYIWELVANEQTAKAATAAEYSYVPDGRLRSAFAHLKRKIVRVSAATGS